MAKRWFTSANRLADAPARALAEVLHLRDAQGGGLLAPEPGNEHLLQAVKSYSSRQNPEINGLLEGIYYDPTLPVRTRGRYATSAKLRDLRERQPLLNDDDLLAVMGTDPLGKISISPRYLDTREKAEGTIGHEYLHHEENVLNPKFNSERYLDTKLGLNPYAEYVFEQMPPEPMLRYIEHPEEKRAELRKALAMRRPLPVMSDLDFQLQEAYDNHLMDLQQDWANDPRWEKAENEALMESMHGRGAFERSDFEREWIR